MKGYHFVLECYATGELRRPDVTEFVELVGGAIGEDTWEDSAGAASLIGFL